MRYTIRRALPSALLLLAAPLALAWDGIGHQAIAIVAYGHLNPKAKATVDRIIRSHPGTTASDADFKSFPMASTWPDVVRKTKDDHPTWHYIDLPINQGEIKGPEPESTNAVSMLVQEENLLNTGSDADRAVALSWVSHLVEDLHQPLHCVTLFSTKHLPPSGDKGGNGFTFAGENGAAMRLHSYWDHALELEGVKDPAKVAEAIEASQPAEQDVEGTDSATFTEWAEEGHKLAQSDVYRQTTNGDWLVEDQPLPQGYDKRAYGIALKRAKIAALRLANLLNAKLGS